MNITGTYPKQFKVHSRYTLLYKHDLSCFNKKSNPDFNMASTSHNQLIYKDWDLQSGYKTQNQFRYSAPLKPCVHCKGGTEAASGK